MEAMTQEFMLHRRPHAEIWSAREGSNDNASRIHFRNKSLMDPKQCQQWTTDPPQKSDGSQQTMVKSQIPQNWEKNPNHKPLQINLTTCPLGSTSETPDAAPASNKLTASNTNLKTIKTCTKHRCSSLDPTTHPIRNRRLRQILTAGILRRQKSRRRKGKP